MLGPLLVSGDIATVEIGPHFLDNSLCLLPTLPLVLNQQVSFSLA
jgi:hypothetical protein